MEDDKKDKWLSIDSAPKGATPEEPCKENWILGTNGIDRRVIRWSMEYPYNEGVWVYGEHSSYGAECAEFLTYHPTHWMPLPSLPN